mgnify:FL=1
MNCVSLALLTLLPFVRSSALPFLDFSPPIFDTLMPWLSLTVVVGSLRPPVSGGVNHRCARCGVPDASSDDPIAMPLVGGGRARCSA